MEGYYDQIMTYLLEQIGYTKKTQNHLVVVMSKILKCKEANKYVPSTVLALKIAKVFGKQVEEIF